MLFWVALMGMPVAVLCYEHLCTLRRNFMIEKCANGSFYQLFLWHAVEVSLAPDSERQGLIFAHRERCQIVNCVCKEWQEPPGDEAWFKFLAGQLIGNYLEANSGEHA